MLLLMLPFVLDIVIVVVVDCIRLAAFNRFLLGGGIMSGSLKLGGNSWPSGGRREYVGGALSVR